MSGTILLIAALVTLFLGSALAESPLSPLLPLVSALGREQSGWRFYNASASFGYSTIALPLNSALPAFALERLQSDYDGTATASMGYAFSGENTRVSLLYSPSYVRRVRFSELKAFNQSLGFSVSRQIVPRWTAALSAQAADSTLDQILFTPAILSLSTNPAANLDDLASAARLGQYSSDQLASILTGAPYVETPARSLVYGASFLSLSVSPSLTYKHTPRLSFQFAGGFNRSQTRNSDSKDLNGTVNYLIPRTTSENVSAEMNYSLSPRTQIGVRGNSNRLESSFARYYVTTSTFNVNHKLTPHWFANLQGGVGVYSPIADPLFARRTAAPAGYMLQMNAGYTQHSHSLMGGYSRVVGDSYGFGSVWSDMTSASWQWRAPGRPWMLHGSGGMQRMFGGAVGNVRYWYANSGVGQSLTRELTLNFLFSYVDRPADSSSFSSLSLQSLTGFSARVALVFSPHGRGPQIGNSGAGARP
ncbi:MAG TPA: hypothetical protein VM120_11735 [Bryobacteraceae bacterium]|nr:hypothetical protein [Bryobacteraceae bacterium]